MEKGYITMAENGFITLTESGRQRAENVLERHTILSDWLINIGEKKKPLWLMPVRSNMI